MAAEMKVINVRFVDPVPKSAVFKYIMASEMGASVLKNVETFKTVYSNKTFDYCSCKKPILMAIDGVSRQLIEDANAGTYVEPENIEEYGRVIRSYLTDPINYVVTEKMDTFMPKKILTDEYWPKNFLNISPEMSLVKNCDVTKLKGRSLQIDLDSISGKKV